ncbi:MAG TPA: protein phosphatase 2C domain-containing protein [Vicinamibacteria bacterium]|nr:protein phosphatase 2C domain-containing protein [Vicinamibacteria bacterium]
MGIAPRLEAGEERVFVEQEHLKEAFFAVGSGRVSVHSRKSPAKATSNEDAAAVLVTGNDSAVLAVADGLGGARAGQHASAMAVQSLVGAVTEGIRGEQEIRAAILDGFERANERVLALGVGAATTLSVAEVDGRSVRPYHVGDSFILVTGNRGRIKLQTISHSPVGYGVESGLLDERAAMHHEERHVISNVIGSSDMRIDVGIPLKLAPRDTLLLASDGLSDNLHTVEIVDRVRRGSLETVTRRLSQSVHDRMAESEGGSPSKPDDVTFLIFRL